MFKDLIIRDMVPRGLADAFITLAAEPEDLNSQPLLGFFGDTVDIITDKAYRACSMHRYGFGMKQLECFIYRFCQLLLPAEYDFRFLHVGGKGVGHIICVFRGWRSSLVTPG